jgi:predicted ribosomally synthesized peptide with nif11-like leader
MSKAEVERFSKDVKASKALQEEVKKAGTSEQAVVDLAKSKGYDFTVEELKAAAAQKKGELSEEQLDKVAGGAAIVTHVVTEVTVVLT